MLGQPKINIDEDDDDELTRFEPLKFTKVNDTDETEEEKIIAPPISARKKWGRSVLLQNEMPQNIPSSLEDTPAEEGPRQFIPKIEGEESKNAEL